MSCASSSSMPSAAVGIGQVRDPGQQLVALPRRRAQLVLRLVELVPQLPQLLDLLGRRLAPGRAPLRRAQRLRPLGQRPPAGISGQQRVEVIRRAAPGQRGTVGLRILPGGLEVDHPRESSRAARGARSDNPPAGHLAGPDASGLSAALPCRTTARPGAGPGRQHRTAEDRHEGDAHGQCQPLAEYAARRARPRPPG